MAIIVLTTAAGAPGASTTALGLALTWGGPTVLVEADPAGTSIVPGWYRGSIDPSARNLVKLALTDHSADLAEAVLDQCVTIDCNPPSEFTRLLLIGLSEPAQAPGLRDWWEPISRALRTLSDAGYTVIVDAGRLTQGSYPMPLLFEADQVLLVCRGTLSSVIRSAPMADELRHTLDRAAAPDQLGLAVIHNSGGLYYSGEEVAKRLTVGFALSIPDEPDAAAVLSDGVPQKRGLIFRLRPPRRSDTGQEPGSGSTTPEDDRPASAGDHPDSDATGTVAAPAASPLLRSYRNATRELTKRIEARAQRLNPTRSKETA